MQMSDHLDSSFSDDLRRNLIHGYRDSASYSDEQLGKVLEALEDPNGDGDTSDSIRDQTIVTLVGDHGYHLGEHGFWGKHNLLDGALQVPMIISDPRRPGGLTSNALVSAMDLYPTIASLAGLGIPGHVDGNILTPLMDDPDRQWTDYIYGHFFDGDSIRTEQYRYIQWTNGQESLYDIIADPGENTDIMNSAPAKDLEGLRAMMQSHFDNGFQRFFVDDTNGIVGDVNQDGVVAGDGTGLAAVDDVTAFMEGWESTNLPLGVEGYMKGDLNFDTRTDLADVLILQRALGQAGAGPFDLSLLRSVPEPSSVLLCIIAGLLLLLRRNH